VSEGSGASEVPAEWLAWVREVSGAVEVSGERRVAGASRQGFAVDARDASGRVRELWLRVDSGAGPQSGTLYSLRREAAVYRALGPTGLKIAKLVALHPTREAFLMERLEGRNWFAEIRDPEAQVAVARAFMVELARLHRIDPHALDLPELGEPASIAFHVGEELDEWQRQYRAQRDPEPLLALALAWLRRHLPPDGDWPLVLVQGDTGPGNFMYRGRELVAITDWELAHWGDLHDDLGWIWVRDAQERFTDLPERVREYERALGREIDRERLRYFRVLAQTRCAIGTRNGLLARDSRGEMANHLIYNTLHMRLLAEALAEAEGVDVPESEPLAAGESESWAFDVALEDLREHVVPGLGQGFAARRAKGLARLLKYLREQERLGPAAREAERRTLGALLGREVHELRPARAALCFAIENGKLDERSALQFCLGAVDRSTQLARGAMGALAERHYAPID